MYENKLYKMRDVVLGVHASSKTLTRWVQKGAIPPITYRPVLKCCAWTWQEVCLIRDYAVDLGRDPWYVEMPAYSAVTGELLLPEPVTPAMQRYRDRMSTSQQPPHDGQTELA